MGIIFQFRIYPLCLPLSRVWLHTAKSIVFCAFEDATLTKPQKNVEVKNVKTQYLEVKSKSKRNAGRTKELAFKENDYDETSYYIENGLRKVYPYYYTYKTFAKARWVNRNILDVFVSEFRFIPEPVEVYEYRIRSGLLTVNNEKVTANYKIRHNDLIATTVHRHELPVRNDPITIVHKDEDILVVDKPPSIPVHPCGRYRHNTLIFILAKEYNLKNVYPIHRLDRLTSGITILRCRPTLDYAISLEQQLHSNIVKKEYICRVDGDFPDGVIICQKPIKVISRLIGVSKVSPDGKMCTTIFEKLHSNGKTSLLSCKPLTGRTHQIRVHLQFLGYPVVKDPLYNNTVFGPEKGKAGITGKTDEHLMNNIIDLQHKKNHLSCYSGGSYPFIEDTMDRSSSDNINVKSRFTNICPHESELACHTKDMIYKNQSYYKLEPDLDNHCMECDIVRNDPKPADLFMCLHAWKYESPYWSYQTGLPVWAEEEWNE
ncbi:hypothetical protein C0J52_06816 [Blattella germanica]|nr:hypothetical protein C0J52_06816 [Blattella germanica]